MGDHELEIRVTDVFLADLPRQIEILKELLEKGDCRGAGRQAHSIKGAAANVGGERLRRVALEMEKAAEDGALVAVKHRMAELETQFLRLKEAMAEDCYAKSY